MTTTQERTTPVQKQIASVQDLVKHDPLLAAAIYGFPQDIGGYMTMTEQVVAYYRAQLPPRQRDILDAYRNSHMRWRIYKQSAQKWCYQLLCQGEAHKKGWEPTIHPDRPIAVIGQTRGIGGLQAYGITLSDEQIARVQQMHDWNVLKIQEPEQGNDSLLGICVEANQHHRFEAWEYYAVVCWAPLWLYNQYGEPKALTVYR